jgi:hypothetical protein
VSENVLPYNVPANPVLRQDRPPRQKPCQSKISNFGVKVIIKEDIASLYISMYNGNVEFLM